MKEINREKNMELEKETEEKGEGNWWEKFKQSLADESQAQKLIELIDKADELNSKKALDRAMEEVQNSKYLQKRGNEVIRLEFEKKLRTIQKRLEREISDNFGSLIKYLREQRGLSLQALGDMTGISPSYIHRIEHGERKAPTVKIIEQLADALNISFAELLKVAKIEINEEEVHEVYELEKMILSNNIAYTGSTEVIKKKEKEALVKLIDKISKLKWDETSKHLETIEIITLIDEFKKIQRA